MEEMLELALFALLIVSVILNLVQLKKIRALNRELKEVGTRVSVTKEELAQIRKRLERMKEGIG
ncbi:MAG: hypothetical protein QXD49_04860 [Archaeoglobaceae archaeon]|uniref:Uncharacterized protein n=1 Tax=Archaeoglobus fulgidus TaxID=2234 RepID=A0A7J3M2S7_ARCFL